MSAALARRARCQCYLCCPRYLGVPLPGRGATAGLPEGMPNDGERRDQLASSGTSLHRPCPRLRGRQRGRWPHAGQELRPYQNGRPAREVCNMKARFHTTGPADRVFEPPRLGQRPSRGHARSACQGPGQPVLISQVSGTRRPAWSPSPGAVPPGYGACRFETETSTSFPGRSPAVRRAPRNARPRPSPIAAWAMP